MWPYLKELKTKLVHVLSAGMKPYTTGPICPFFKDLKCYGFRICFGFRYSDLGFCRRVIGFRARCLGARGQPRKTYKGKEDDHGKGYFIYRKTP